MLGPVAAAVRGRGKPSDEAAPEWKWQLKKGPPWPREKGPPRSPSTHQILGPPCLSVPGLSCGLAWDRARSRRQGRQPREAGAERSDAP